LTVGQNIVSLNYVIVMSKTIYTPERQNKCSKTVMLFEVRICRQSANF